LKELRQLADHYPEIELEPIRLVLDSSAAAASPSQPPASNEAPAPRAKKSKKGCPAITKHKQDRIIIPVLVEHQ